MGYAMLAEALLYFGILTLMATILVTAVQWDREHPDMLDEWWAGARRRGAALAERLSHPGAHHR
jgi:hypothetical protein